MKCGQCKKNEATHKYGDIPACRDCLEEHWRDADMGMDESFDDFINYTCYKLKNPEVEDV